MRTYENIDAFIAAAGEDLGLSKWHTVTREQINMFADATGDHQWIHVDLEQAAIGPFGTTIAHGYLTLSLLPVLLKETYTVKNIAMAVNYGANKIRFPAPVTVDSRLRAKAKLLTTTSISIGQQFVIQATIEREGSDKPVCIAAIITVMAGED